MDSFVDEDRAATIQRAKSSRAERGMFVGGKVDAWSTIPEGLDDDDDDEEEEQADEEGNGGDEGKGKESEAEAGGGSADADSSAAARPKKEVISAAAAAVLEKVKGARVMVRLDLDLRMEEADEDDEDDDEMVVAEGADNEMKLSRAISTLATLVKAGAGSIIILASMGDTERGKASPQQSFAPVAAALTEQMERLVRFAEIPYEAFAVVVSFEKDRQARKEKEREKMEAKARRKEEREARRAARAARGQEEDDEEDEDEDEDDEEEEEEEEEEDDENNEGDCPIILLENRRFFSERILRLRTIFPRTPKRKTLRIAGTKLLHTRTSSPNFVMCLSWMILSHRSRHTRRLLTSSLRLGSCCQVESCRRR